MQKKVRTIFFLLFALSGFCGLIYESIWTHYLKLFLGHAAYAQSLVLAIFMGGMALGSYLCGRYSSRWKNLLLGYALAEGIIGLLALGFHNVFDEAVQLSYTAIIPNLGSPIAVNVFKWTLSALLILPQTVLLGMTFPLMSAGILRIFPREPGRLISLLYFTNSIGAAVGVLASGFMLIQMVGLPGTIRIAGIINVALSIFVYLLIRKEQGGLPPFKAVEQRYEPYGTYQRADEHPSRSWYRFMLLASLVTGAASFIYEIGWIRMLSLVLGSSTHAFELMLSAFIFGLAFGGLWMQRRIDHIANPVRFLMMVQVIMGSLALSTLLLYGNAFEVMQWVLKNVSRTDAGYMIFNLSSHAIAMAIMLPATFCAGMTLPLITYSLLKKGYGEQSIGAVYAANTVGAIIGVFFSIHFGMPLLGLKGLITFGAGLDLALGLALAWSASAEYRGKRVPGLLTVLCICVVVGSALFVKLDPYKMASGVYRHGSLLTAEKTTLLYHKDGKTATVSLVLDHEGNMNIRTNGKVDASVRMMPGRGENPDEPTMALLAVIPMALNPQAKTAANIGLGAGITTNTLLLNNLLQQVDTVEIEQAIVEAAKNFGSRTELVYTDPRSAVYIDDAKTFFSTRNKKYDIIVSEPSNPWVSGVAGLFSEEFYRLTKRHLSENGLFCQWIQLYEIDINLVASVLKAIAANFSDFVAYMTTDHDLLIIARNGSALRDIDSALLANPGIAAALRAVDIKGVQDIEFRKVGDRRVLGTFFETFPVRANSDYYPVLDLGAARTRFLNANAKELHGFTHEPLPALEMLMGSRLSGKDTNVTPTVSYPKTQLAFTAMALRDFYLHGNFGNRGHGVPENIKQQAFQIKRLLYDCRTEAEQDERVISLYTMAVNMIPFLRPNELDAVWKALEAGGCVGSFTPREKEWLSLLKAVSRRDAVAMASAAKALLEKEQDIPQGPMRYLVAAGMLGYLVQGNREEALRLWRDYKSKIYETGQPALLFRLLTATLLGP